MRGYRKWKTYQRRAPGGGAGFRVGLIRMFFSRHSSPESIALGCAIGVFVAFLPFVGVQMILAVLLAMLLKAHPIMAMTMTWISNPLTLAPLFAFSYRVGRLLLPGKDELAWRSLLNAWLYKLENDSICEYYTLFVDGMKLGGRLFPYLLVGGAFIGMACACCTYPVAVFLTRRYRAAREKHRMNRRLFLAPGL